MEQIIPILIAAVVFGFQAYQNYQKEQEKARKRNPGQRPPNQQDENNRPVIVDMSQPEQTVAHEDLPQIPEPIAEHYQEYAGFIDEKQLAHYTQKRKPKKQDDLLKPLEVTDEDDDVTTDQDTFDLRTAVIHATILERPYQ